MSKPASFFTTLCTCGAVVLLSLIQSGCGNETANESVDSARQERSPAPQSTPVLADNATDEAADSALDGDMPQSPAEMPGSPFGGGFGAQPATEAALDKEEKKASEPESELRVASGLPSEQTLNQSEAMGESLTELSASSESAGRRGADAAGMGSAGSPARRVMRSRGRTVPAEGQPDASDRSEMKLSEAETGADRRTVFELLPGEELWVIAKRDADSGLSQAEHDLPGSGCLMAVPPNAVEHVAVPLKHTSVEGRVDGYIAGVTVTQQFVNPYSSKIEAVYVFPLPQNSAVDDFVMTIGERRIRGVIREREQAQRIYDAAKKQGKVASLLTQERPNIFTQKVANIEPGRQIDVSIHYFSTLQYDNGAYEFVFPMVVGPRFNPAGSTDGVGALPHRSTSGSGQATDVTYLKPEQRSGHDVDVSVTINAGTVIEDIRSVNHGVSVTRTSESIAEVTLDDADSIPNRDFVLRFQVAGDRVKTAMLTHEDQRGRFFTMMLYPPASLQHVQRSPMEMVFVLDCSGSMKGRPIEQAKAAVVHTLQSLTPRDTFQIIRFSSDASQLGTAPVQATPANVRQGLSYLAQLSGSGGTQMIKGIRAALDFPHDEGRFRVVSFMTDGFIGNEQQILHALSEKLGDSRIFSFGVGQSPNRFLMDRMALVGRGAVTYLSLNDDAVQIMEAFNEQISHPAMTDLVVDWGDMEVSDVYPAVMPDLIVGRPVTVTGRFSGEPDTVRVGGRVDMMPASFEVSVNDDDAADEHEGIAAVWARMKIRDLMLQRSQTPDRAAYFQEEVLTTALDYNLMSAFTAFVAVDSLSSTAGDHGTTVAVPVPVPEGVRYDTTVGNPDNAQDLP